MANMGQVTGWITVNGVHIPLYNGESSKSAAERYIRYRKAKSMPTRSKKMILEDAKAKKNSVRRERKNIKANKNDKFRNEDRKKNILEKKLEMQDLRNEYNRASYRDTLKSGNKIKKASSINKYEYKKAKKEYDKTMKQLEKTYGVKTKYMEEHSVNTNMYNKGMESALKKLNEKQGKTFSSNRKYKKSTNKSTTKKKRK